MKNLLLSLPVKSIANKLRHAATLLLPGFLLLIGHAACAEQSQPTRTNGTPATSQSCGAAALAQLAHVLKTDPKVEQSIRNTAPPQGGFSMAELQTLAAKHGIALEAVRLPKGAEIAAPCIARWKIGHYSVIKEKRASHYWVVDGQSARIWMDWRTIQENSSAFLVPAQVLPGEWQRLTQKEAAALRGAHDCDYCSATLPDDEDPPTDCCDDNDDQDADCDPPSANDGASDGGDNPPPPPCCCDMGLARWHVSQPYINLWLIDRPLLYKTSNGKWFPLKLTYNSHGASHGTNSFGFGPKWECNWIAMVQFTSTSFPMMTNYRSGGGLVQVNANCTGTGGGSACQVNRSAQSVAVSPTGVATITSSRGGMNHYGFVYEAGPGLTNYYMDNRIDRYGRTVEYNYQVENGVAHLRAVKDTDGKISTLTYDGDLISTVSDPYGHTAHFYYMGGRLTNITDSIGMSSTFYYTTSNTIIQMVTDYGPTTFEHFSDTTNNRALRVTEANGEHQLYASVPATPGSLPTSYHWNRSQYTAISEEGKNNPLAMLPEDYDKAEMQQWLFYARNDSDPYVVSDTPSLSAPPVDPLLMYRPGMLTFTYQGQTNDAYTGSLKRLTSISRDGVLQVGIERNDRGRPTLVTNFNGDGSMAIYSYTFDLSGRYLQKQIGPHNELTRGYGYHSIIPNLLVSVTNAASDVTRYTHDTNTMKVASITFPTGLIRTNEYSGGFLIRQTDQGVRTNSFTYSNGNVATQTNELGLVTTNSYDLLNRLRQINFPDGTTISNFYDKLDLVGVKDRLGLWTRYTYDSVRQLRGETNANGAVTTYEYCGCGSPSSTTRWNGTTPLTDTFAYDILGRLTNATYADGYQLNYLYNNSNLLSAVSDSSGLTLALNYIQIGQKFKISTAYLAGQQIVSNTYDDYGRLASTLDRNGITVTNAYDLVNRLVTRVTLDQNLIPYATNSYVYTAQGLTNMVDALNHTNWFVRDVAGRLLFQTNANNEVLQFTYNPADEILTLTDGKSQTTHWNYDEYGRMTNKLDQANAEILRYTYDPENRLTNRWSAAKGNTKYKYDSVGNLTNINYPLSGAINYSYDSLNRLTNMVDALGTTAFNYTGSGQLLTEDGPFASDVITNFYWNRMRTNFSLAQPTGVWTNAFSYSSANRLQSVTSPAGTFTYYYDEPSTRLTNLALPSGAYVNNVYDTMSRLTNTFLYNYTNYPLDGYVYQYDPENQRTNEVRADSSTVDYAYDNIGQLKIADSSVPAEDRGYTYDTAWNLNHRTNNGSLSTFLVDNKNELTNAFATTDTYDSNGNLTGIGTGRVYVYDDENRLAQWFSYQLGSSSPTNGDLRTDFVYDGLGRLRERIEYVLSCLQSASNPPPEQGPAQQQDPGGGGNTNCTWNLNTARGVNPVTYYIYDGWRVIQERDSNSVPICAYTRGNDLSMSLEGAGGIGGLLSRTRYFAGGPTSSYLYFSDGNGNITYMLATNQTMVASYRYDPFGNIISKSGSLADVNVYRFSSKEVHVNSGMYYYGFRFYDPNLQRWINRDPIEEEGDINMYSFAGNAPISLADPFGLQCLLGMPQALLTPKVVVPRPLIEQAIELNRGAARVPLPDGRKLDLFGRGHFDKATQENVPTPHVHEPAPANLAPRFSEITRPARLGDLLDAIIQLKGSLAVPGAGPGGCTGCGVNAPPNKVTAPPGVTAPPDLKRESQQPQQRPRHLICTDHIDTV